MNTNNLKDVISSFCAWITGVGGALLIAHTTGQIKLPDSIVGILGIAVVVALATTQVLTGKNPNLSTKSDIQVADQNAQAKLPEVK